MPLFAERSIAAKSANPYGGMAASYFGSAPYPLDVFNRNPPPTALSLIRENNNTAYACTTINSHAVAKTRLRLYVKTRKGEAKPRMSRRGHTAKVLDKAWARLEKSTPEAAGAEEIEEITESPLLDLLHQPTGPEQNSVAMTLYAMVELTQRYLEIVGRAYWWVPPGGMGGTPSEIWLLAPQYVTEWPGSGDGPVIEQYTFSIGTGKIEYPPEEIIPFRFCDEFTGGYTGGRSPLRACIEQVNIGRSADALTNAQVSNGGKPSALFIPSGDSDGNYIDDIQGSRLRIALRQGYAQAGAGGIMVATHPGQLQILNWPINDIIDATRYGMTQRLIAQCFSVPMTKINRDVANRASADSGEYAHAIDAVIPRLRRMRDTLNLLARKYDDTGRTFFEFDDPDGLLDADKDAERTEAGTRAGTLTRNEHRAAMGKPPVDGGDIFLVPNNMVPLLDDGKPDPAYNKSAPKPGGGEGDVAPPDGQGGALPPKPGKMLRLLKSLMREVRGLKSQDLHRRAYSGNGGNGHAMLRRGRVAPVVALAKYSDDQPRADDGKWTGDGGSTGGDSAPAPADKPASGKSRPSGASDFDGDPTREAMRTFAADVNARHAAIDDDVEKARQTLADNFNAEIDKRREASPDADLTQDDYYDAMDAAHAPLTGSLSVDTDAANAVAEVAFDDGDDLKASDIDAEEMFPFAAEAKKEAIEAAIKDAPSEYADYIESHRASLDEALDSGKPFDADRIFAEDDEEVKAVPAKVAAKYADDVTAAYERGVKEHADAAKAVASRAAELYERPEDDNAAPAAAESAVKRALEAAPPDLRRAIRDDHADSFAELLTGDQLDLSDADTFAPSEDAIGAIADRAVRDAAKGAPKHLASRVRDEADELAETLAMDGKLPHDPFSPVAHEGGSKGLRQMASRLVGARAKFSDDEPRDNDGKWTGGGGGSSSAAGTGTARPPKEKPTASKPKDGGKGKRVGRVPEQAPTPRTKSEIAKQSAVRVDKEVQRYAEERTEAALANHVKGVSLPDSEPVDVVVPADASTRDQWQDEANRYAADKEAGKKPSPLNLEGKALHGIESKCLVSNSNDKITMDTYSQIRKVNWEKDRGATVHTLVTDDREVMDANGKGKHDDSKRTYYYRRGVAGSARIGSLYKCKDIVEVKRLMNMPEADLPDAAQRTDGELRKGTWKSFADDKGKGFRNSKTGQEVRAKK